MSPAPLLSLPIFLIPVLPHTPPCWTSDHLNVQLHPDPPLEPAPGKGENMEEDHSAGQDRVKAGGLNIDIHPLLIINISDHSTRKRSLAKGKATRVLGVLLGLQVDASPRLQSPWRLPPACPLESTPPARGLPGRIASDSPLNRCAACRKGETLRFATALS